MHTLKVQKRVKGVFLSDQYIWIGSLETQDKENVKYTV
jgi:hypothetical protein